MQHPASWLPKQHERRRDAAAPHATRAHARNTTPARAFSARPRRFHRMLHIARDRLVASMTPSRPRRAGSYGPPRPPVAATFRNSGHASPPSSSGARAQLPAHPPHARGTGVWGIRLAGALASPSSLTCSNILVLIRHPDAWRCLPLFASRRRRRLRRRKPRRECDTDTLRAVLANARPNRPTLAHAGAPLSNAQSVARRRPTHEPWPLPPVVPTRTFVSHPCVCV